MIPEWCKRAAEEIEEVPDCPRSFKLATEDGAFTRAEILAAIVAKHAPTVYAVPANQHGQEVLVTLTDQVRELVEAAREEEQDNVQLFGRARLLRALKPFNEVSQ